MAYNKSYNKNPGRQNNRPGKKGQKPRINVVQVVSVLLLLGLLYAIIFHGSEIRNMIAKYTNSVSEEEEALTNIYNEYKNFEEDELVEDIVFEEDRNAKDTVVAATEDHTIDNTNTNEPTPTKRLIEKIDPAENKPALTKADDYSKHELERFVGQDNGKYGVEDLTAKKILIEPIYDRIKEIRQGLKNPYIIVCKNELWGVVNVRNEVIIPIEHTNINEYVYKRDEIYLQLSKKGADGKTIDGYARMPEGKMVVPFKYGYVTRLTNDYKYFKVKNNTNDRNYGIVDQNNTLILPIEYATINTTSKAESYAIISKFIPEPSDGRTYYISGIVRLADGKIVVPVEYQELEIIGPVSFIKAKKNGLYGCINEKNEIIVPFQEVTSVGMTISMADDSSNRIRFTLPNGERVAYDTKGQRVPVD